MYSCLTVLLRESYRKNIKIIRLYDTTSVGNKKRVFLACMLFSTSAELDFIIKCKKIGFLEYVLSRLK